MAEKRYYWLKLQEDFFGSKRIKKLRNLAGGDTYTIIYLKMQLLAMKSDGVLIYTGLEPTFAEELALDLDEKTDNVAVTVNYLLSCGLLETNDDKEYFVPYAVENTGKEGSSAKRVREYRERKALQCNADVTPPALHCHGEKEEEKDIETEKEKRVDYQLIADMYNETCVSFPKVKSLSDSRKKAIKARLKTYTEDDFRLLFQKAEASDFLRGKNNRDWTATFDWLIKDANMAKVLDGNYDNTQSSQSKPTGGRKEMVPGWMKNQDQQQAFDNRMAKDLAWLKEFDRKQKTAGNDPDVAARAEALKRSLSGGATV